MDFFFLKGAVQLVAILGSICLFAIGPIMLYWGITDFKEEGPDVGPITIILLACILCLFEGAIAIDLIVWMMK